MTDEQIRMVLRFTGREARILLDQGEIPLYRDIQDRMVGLVREYGVTLPLNCLQFLYHIDRRMLAERSDMDAVSPF